MQCILCGKPSETQFCAACDPPVTEKLLEQKNEQIEQLQDNNAELEAIALEQKRKLEELNRFRLEGFRAPSIYQQIFEPQTELSEATNVNQVGLFASDLVHEWTYEQCDMAIQRAIGFIEICKQFQALKQKTVKIKMRDKGLIEKAAETRAKFKEDSNKKAKKREELTDNKVINKMAASYIAQGLSKEKALAKAQKRYEMIKKETE